MILGDTYDLKTRRSPEISPAPRCNYVPAAPRSNADTSSSALDELPVGKILDDRFKILGSISRGGMSRIYEALDRETGKSVAIKILLLRYESDPQFFSRFQREEAIGLTLDHPSIVKILPACPDKSRPYIVMEYLEGQTLGERIRKEGRIPEKEAVHIASMVCSALDYLHHKGVVHRDLKPDNIMLCADGSIRIMDFGIAKFGSTRLTFGGLSTPMGTPDYIAPEQVRGKRGDARTDIYALGMMLYEMTTGASAYPGENPFVVMNARLSGDPEAPRRCNPRLSAQIEEIILHAIERNPAKRYSGAAAMQLELDDYSRVTVTDRSQNLQPARFASPWSGLLRRILFVVGAQIVFFLLLFWWFSHNSRHSMPTPSAAPVTAVHQ